MNRACVAGVGIVLDADPPASVLTLLLGTGALFPHMVAALSLVLRAASARRRDPGMPGLTRCSSRLTADVAQRALTGSQLSTAVSGCSFAITRGR